MPELRVSDTFSKLKNEAVASIAVFRIVSELFVCDRTCSCPREQ